MNVTEVDEFTASIPVIDDGDTCGNQEHLATAQALANRTKNLNRRTTDVESVTRGELAPVLLQFTSADNTLDALPLPNESKLGTANAVGTMGRRLAAWVRYTHDKIQGLRPGNTAHWFPPIQAYSPAALTKWDTTIDATIGRSLTQISADGTPLYFALPFPGIAGVIKEVGLYVTGGAGHAGLPATRPRLRLVRASVNAGVVTHNEVAAADDPSGSVAAYQVLHTIPLTSLNLVVQPPAQSLWTYLHVTGESGANAINGEFKITGLYVTTAPS